MANIIRPTETWKLKEKNFIDKAKNKLLPDDYVPFEKPLVEAVDALLAMSKAKGYPRTVSRESDWEIVEFIVKIFATLYPDHWQDFVKKQNWNKTNQENQYASKREQGGAQIRHLLEIPKPMANMIERMFPDQKLQDKKFAIQFSRRLPLFRWADKI